jgi:hypothetical protein
MIHSHICFDDEILIRTEDQRLRPTPHSITTTLHQHHTPLTPHSTNTTLHQHHTPPTTHSTNNTLHQHHTPPTPHSTNTTLHQHHTPPTPRRTQPSRTQHHLSPVFSIPLHTFHRPPKYSHPPHTPRDALCSFCTPNCFQLVR